MAHLCCTIEMEPRTLNQGQLTHAREVAADIAQNMEPEAASDIFINNGQMMEKEDDQLPKIVECEENKADDLSEGLCQCLNTVESQDQIRLREPLSAPF